MKFKGIGFTVASATWMGLIFYLSSLPGVSSGDGYSHSIEVVTEYWWGGVHSYAGHIFLYGVLAALIQAVLWGWNLGFRIRWIVISALVATFYGVTDEYHQSFVFGREASEWDVLVNAVAATISAIISWTVAAGKLASLFKALRHNPPNLNPASIWTVSDE